MRALNIFLIVFNLMMFIWSVINIHGEYSSIWLFNLVQSLVFLLFWSSVYINSKANTKK